MAGFGGDEDEDKRLFVQTLFNRLMFVYFLSRKGWLAFGKATRTTSTPCGTTVPNPRRVCEQEFLFRPAVPAVSSFGLNNYRSLKT